MPLQIRRGTDAERQNMTQPLASGELLYVTDQQRLYVGDNTTIGGVPVTGFNAEDAVDAVGAALVAGTHENIAFTYGPTQDSAGRIDASVSIANLLQDLDLNGFDINGTGNINVSGQIQADSFKGSVFADGSTLLVDAVDGTFNLNGTVKTDVIPSANAAFDLGSSSHKFKDLWLSGSSIHLGDAVITSTSTAVNLPAGSTIGGQPVVTEAFGGSTTTDITGSVFDYQSTMMLNADTSALTVASAEIGRIGFDTTKITITDGYDLTVQVNNKSLFLNGLMSGTTGSKGAFLKMQQSRGTHVAPTVLNAGDWISGLEARGYNGNQYALGGVLAFVQDTDAAINPGSDYIQSYLAFSLAGTAALDLTKVVTINHNGVVSAPVFSAGDGTAGAPSIVFGTDGGVDTGFFHPADGVICISTNATEKVRVDTGGMRVSGFMKVGGFATGSLPSPAEAGMIVLDTTTNQFKGYNGSAWVILG